MDKLEELYIEEDKIPILERDLESIFYKWLDKQQIKHEQLAQGEFADLILKIDNKKIICEIKTFENNTNLALLTAIGQVITGKELKKADEMWIVFLGHINDRTYEIIKAGEKYGIKFFLFSAEKTVYKAVMKQINGIKKVDIE